MELHDLPIAAYHVTAALPPIRSPDSLKTPTVPNSLPAFLQRSGRTVYEDLFTFGSHPAGDQVAPDDENTDEYTHVEWLFLVQVLDYCRGREELCRGISIPEELCAGEYLEGLGEERCVSLRFPMLESLFARAARTWPTSVFNIFAPARVAPVYDHHGIQIALPSDQGRLQLPTPESTTDASIPSLDD